MKDIIKQFHSEMDIDDAITEYILLMQNVKNKRKFNIDKLSANFLRKHNTIHVFNNFQNYKCYVVLSVTNLPYDLSNLFATAEWIFQKCK